MTSGLRRTASVPVESFLVQAGLPATRMQRTRSQVLVRHLLSRFQTQSTEEDEQTGRKTLFACAASGIPPVFAVVMLYPAYHPLAMPPQFRPYWSQVGDHYLYVLYVFVTMAIAAIVLWETIFPDLLDVITLGVLPLAPRLLLRARWKAVVFSIGMILLCVAAPGTLLLPAVAESTHVLRHIAGHAVATGAAGLSAFASLLAVQSLLEITLGTRRAKRCMPAFQAAALLALFLLLGYTPRLLDGLQHGALQGRLPSVWFLGIYEQVKGGGASATWRALAWRGWLTTALCCGAAALTYSRAYQRRTLYLVESGNAAAPGFRVPATIAGFVHRRLVRTPGERATFHLVAQTAFRVSKLRTSLVIYIGIGVAVLLATSVHAPARAIAIACCAVVLGCTAMLDTQIMPRSAWVVQVLPKPQDSSYLRGSTKLITLWAAIATFSTLVMLAAAGHLGQPSTRALLVAASAALVLPAALGRLAMLGARFFPFTHERESTPERFVFTILRNAVGVPCGVVAFGMLAVHAVRSAASIALWCVAVCAIALLERHAAARQDARST